MIKFSGNAKVKTIKKRFSKEFGVEIEVFDSEGNEVSEEDNYSSIRSNRPDSYEWGDNIPGNMNVENVEKSFEKNYNFKIRIKAPEKEAAPKSTLEQIRRAWDRVGDLPPLANWLNEKVQQEDMTPGFLADEAGVSKQTIHKILRGETENPTSSTRRKIEDAIGEEIPKDTEEDIEQDASVAGMGSLVDIGDPFDISGLKGVSGVYVLYDVSERPIYVGQSQNIQNRIEDHSNKKWFVDDIVDTASYIEINDEKLRKQVESVLISFLKSNAVINKKGTSR